eukprot:TRINITY_DN13104_c0_g1_i1.p1 TRINITY_DN13104_c0_g1~~TRINITY_DN13104_c0_g1_i1.p1  ORF type:complete len:682 (-),score=120.43 TRINITY_DN13104_c0_g1_i1:64-2109(-)
MMHADSLPAVSPLAATSARLVEFQRNAAFVAFMVCVAMAAGLYVIEALRYTLVPIIWACFFALPLERLCSYIDNLLTSLGSFIDRFCCRRGKEVEEVKFRHVPGQNCIVIANTRMNQNFVDRMSDPVGYVLGGMKSQTDRRGSAAGTPPGEAPAPLNLDASASHTAPSMNSLGSPVLSRRRVSTRQVEVTTAGTPLKCLGCSLTMVFKCCQRRVRVSQLEEPSLREGGLPKRKREVNRLMKDWCYYVKKAHQDHRELHLELYLDRGLCQYPAVLTEGLDELHEHGAHERRDASLRGTLVVDKSSPFSWSVAVFTALMLLCGGLACFVCFVYIGAETFQTNLQNYEDGVKDFIDLLKKYTERWIKEDVWEQIGKKAQQFLQEYMAQYVSSILTEISSVLFQCLMFLIYLLFWLAEPIRVSSPVVDVFKSYLFLKTLMCLLFASLISWLLWALSCGLWPLFFIVTFILNYIPEIGPLFVGLLCMPAVLFDGSIPTPEQRVRNTVILVMMGCLIKVITGNVIEVRMYTTRGSEFMRMHSMVLMALIMIFGSILGVTGMFLSVPLVAAIKYYLVSVDMPPMLLDALLFLIEGDESAPHRNFVDKQRLKTEATEDFLASQSFVVSEPWEGDANESTSSHEMVATSSMRNRPHTNGTTAAAAAASRPLLDAAAADRSAGSVEIEGVA